MRTTEVMNQAGATAGSGGTGPLALGGQGNHTSEGGATTPPPGLKTPPTGLPCERGATTPPSGLKTPPSGLSLDLSATYTQIIQQVAAKIYPYDPASVVASLAALGPASHLPLALTAPHALSLTASKVASDAEKSALTAGLPPTGLNMAAWTTIEKPEETKVKMEEDGNDSGALDLRTQGLKSLYSSYRRATLDDIKPKVVEDIWIENDLSLTWTESRVAAYNPAQKLFMCVDCECVGFLSRVAEHWLGAHANLRVFACPRCPYTSAWSRCVKMHTTRQHNEQFADVNMWKENAALIEVTRLMQELRNKVENRIDSTNALADKRFYCPHCPYATDRRDLYTRHENIHKDDKPFHCYLCFKQFNRADHVKKHFVRMHPDLDYDITKIRKQQHQGNTTGRSTTMVVRGHQDLEYDISKIRKQQHQQSTTGRSTTTVVRRGPPTPPATTTTTDTSATVPLEHGKGDLPPSTPPLQISVSVPSPPHATPAVVVEEEMVPLRLTAAEEEEEDCVALPIPASAPSVVTVPSAPSTGSSGTVPTPCVSSTLSPSSTPEPLVVVTPLGLGAASGPLQDRPPAGNREESPETLPTPPMTRRRRLTLALTLAKRRNNEDDGRRKEEEEDGGRESPVLGFGGHDNEEHTNSPAAEQPKTRNSINNNNNSNNSRDSPEPDGQGLALNLRSRESLVSRESPERIIKGLALDLRPRDSPEPLGNGLALNLTSRDSPEPLRKGLALNLRSRDSPESLQKDLALNVPSTDSPEPLRKGLQALGTNSTLASRTDSPEPSSFLRARRRGDRAYSCPYCHWSGSDNWCLKRHMNTHIKPFACVMCDYKAARAERLSTHVLKVHNKRICNKCNYLAETQERLLEHTREEHHNNPYSRRYICSHCVLTFDTRPALETHQHLSHPNLGLHQPQHHPMTPVEGTEEGSQGPEQLEAHDLSLKGENRYGQDDDRYTCSSSRESRRFTSSGRESRYMHSSHTGGRESTASPILCPADDCGFSATTTGSLASHVRQHHHGRNDSPSCPHCGYQLTHDELSRDHWLTHHNEVCAACVHVFTAVYGPQLWKKVHMRPGTLESPLDAIVTGLNRKRTAHDGLPAPLGMPLTVPTTVGLATTTGPATSRGVGGLETSHNLVGRVGMVSSPTNGGRRMVSSPTITLMGSSPTNQRDTPSPDSDQLDTDSERFNKRSRKQSCPKKVVLALTEEEEVTEGIMEGMEERNQAFGSSSTTNQTNRSGGVRKRSSLRAKRRAALLAVTEEMEGAEGRMEEMNGTNQASDSSRNTTDQTNSSIDVQKRSSLHAKKQRALPLTRPSGFSGRQCHRCPRRPVFASRARLQLHLKWNHNQGRLGALRRSNSQKDLTNGV